MADVIRRFQAVEPTAVGHNRSFAPAGKILAIPLITQPPRRPKRTAGLAAVARNPVKTMTRIGLAGLIVPSVVPAS